VTRFLCAALAVVGLLLGNQAATPQHTTIDGKWHFVLDTPGGDRELDAEFTVAEDGKVTGNFGKADVAGTFKDGHLALDFTMTSEESGETAPMKIDGKLDDGMALGGTWEFSSYNGTFKASHPKT
jgi:hypothetical protein